MTALADVVRMPVCPACFSKEVQVEGTPKGLTLNCLACRAVFRRGRSVTYVTLLSGPPPSYGVYAATLYRRGRKLVVDLANADLLATRVIPDAWPLPVWAPPYSKRPGVVAFAREHETEDRPAFFFGEEVMS